VNIVVSIAVYSTVCGYLVIGSIVCRRRIGTTAGSISARSTQTAQ
jgi:hypothetical protein